MKRSQRLQIIIDLQQRQENEALQLLGRRQQQLNEQQAQLDNLLNYRQQYLNKLLERQKTGMNVNQLLELRAFADKLDKAIEGQRLTVRQQERECQKARDKWQESHQRSKSLLRLGEIAVAEETQLEIKREQSEQDARAARSSRKDGANNA
ncbi:MULTISPECIES: flagellar export protein FliJ [Methylomonas]|uniref:flagellar export protein FliJ n=1 Tax=Methylomonas TaxID=416 RepID=UPI0012327A52|nr:flagellar export protein FliJ [Methylomonas rhizoryzae]